MNQEALGLYRKILNIDHEDTPDSDMIYYAKLLAMNDLTKWTFVETNEINVPMASTAVVIGEDLYYLASMPEGDKPVFKAIDPKRGKWTISDSLDLDFRLWDPDFLLDDDGKLYLYWGC